MAALLLAIPLTPTPVVGAGAAAAAEPTVPTASLEGATFAPLSPTRIWDTRVGPGPVGRVGPGATLSVIVAGVGGAPGTGVTSVVVNVTAVAPTTGTFVTVGPAARCDHWPPT